MDKALLLIILPFIIWLLIVGWLFYATFGSRRVNLSLKGLGISIAIQTRSKEDVISFKDRSTDVIGG